MKKLILLTLAAAILLSLWGCGSYTRIEEDTYTISHRDSTDKFFVKNAPGNRDNGVIYPSSREFKSERYLLQEDSVVIRKYPDFIRLGVFESVGTFGTGGDNALGSGMFGIFHDWDKDWRNFRGNSDYFFSGGIYRLGIGEWRLRWFRDAPNWTYGIHLYETIMPDARVEKWLVSPSFYVRKRFFLKETIPYLTVTPAFGIGFWPSQYFNVSASLDLGSLSGLNFRAYAGFAAGRNPSNSPQVEQSRFTDEAQDITYPYAGLGISFLDFLNRVEETKIEWKNHPHSGWNIGVLQWGFLGSLTGGSDDTDEEDEEALINGMLIRLLNASTAIPVLNNKFYAGTSLVNFVGLNEGEWGAGVLPIRVGYFQTVIPDELIIEPFIEYNYYPSNFFHTGGRLNLRIHEYFNVSAVLGYAAGSTEVDMGNQVRNTFGTPQEFSGAYFGVMLNVPDNIFYPQHLRYNKKDK